MTENLSFLSISAFKKVAFENPQEIFEQIRKHNIIEQAYLTILFSELEAEWNIHLSIPITAKKINCLTELLLTKDYNIELNLGYSDLFTDENFKKHLDPVFILSSEKNHHLFNQEAAIDNKAITNAIYVFNQILMYFYRERLQELYIKYLMKNPKYKLCLAESEDFNWSPSLFSSPPMTPRYSNSDRVLTPRDHKKIFDRLKEAEFNVEKYQLPEFRQFYSDEKSDNSNMTEGNNIKAQESEERSGRCLSFCNFL